VWTVASRDAVMTQTMPRKDAELLVPVITRRVPELLVLASDATHASGHMARVSGP